MKWIPLKGLKKNELPKGEVLVTNNATSTNSNGGMSHIWIAYVYKEGKEYVGRFIPHGVMGTVKISNITHYCLPTFEEAE